MRELEGESALVDFEGASSAMSKEDMKSLILIRGDYGNSRCRCDR